MRTISAAQEKVLTADAGYDTHVKVSVKDYGGTFRDLSSLEGFDWIVSVSMGEGVDQPVKTANITLTRENDSLSLAPLMSASKLNVVWGGGGQLLAIGRAVKIETACTPLGSSPGGGDWVTRIEGVIDELDLGGAEGRVSLTCLDDGARLQKLFLEKERVYGLGLTAGINKWTPSTAVALNDKVIPDPNHGYYYNCTTAGTTGVAPPTWGAGPFSDGTAQWTRVGATSNIGAVENQLQAMLDDAGAGVTLYTPVSPSWAVTAWNQDRGPLLDALAAIAGQIGWDLRYKWHEASGAHRLTFYEPDRSRVTALRTFASDEYGDVKYLRVLLAGIRNAVQIGWWDPTDLDAAGKPKYKTALFEDAASISKYGRQFCEIRGTPNIDTITEVNKYGNAVLSDLSEPGAELQLELPYFWPAEIGDLYGFSANGTHWDTTQTFAVVGIQDTLERDSKKTVLTLRGKPAGGYKKWHNQESRPGLAMPTNDQPPDGPQSTTASAVYGGADVSFNESAKDWKFKDGEIYVGSSSGFTMDDTTLYDTGRKRRFQVRGVAPGTTRYARLKLKDDNGNVSISPEVSFTSKYIQRSELDSALKTGFYAKRAADQTVEVGGSSSTPKQAQLNNETWDNGGNYDAATYKFTAPENGVYHLRAQLVLTGILVGDSGCATLKKNGSTTVATGPNTMTAVDPAALTNKMTLTLDVKLSLTAGDYVELWYTTYTPGTASATLVAASSYFTGEETLES